MTLVGGMGTVFGPIVGAGIIITMQNYLAGFGEWVLVIQGAIFVRHGAAVPARHRGRNHGAGDSICSGAAARLSDGGRRHRRKEHPAQ